MNKKKESKIINNIFAFVQTLCMVLALLLVLTYSSFLSYGSITHSLKSANYYEQVQDGTFERMYDILIPTGLPSTIVDDVFTVELYQENVNGYIKGLLSQSRFEFDTEFIRTGLKSNIHDFLETEGYLGYVDQDIVEEVVDALIQTFETNAKLPFIVTIADYIILYRTLLTYVIPAVLLIVGFCALMNYKINKWKHRFMRYQSYSLMATGLMIMIIPIGIKLWGGYTKIAFEPLYINDFIVHHINTLLQVYIATGVLFILCGVSAAWMAEKGRKTLIQNIKLKYKRVHKIDGNNNKVEV